MCKVIICANQKGGVAKSTSVVNLGIGLANKGKTYAVPKRLCSCSINAIIELCLCGGSTRWIYLMKSRKYVKNRS